MTPIIVNLLPQFQVSISFLELAHVPPVRNMLSWYCRYPGPQFSSHQQLGRAGPMLKWRGTVVQKSDVGIVGFLQQILHRLHGTLSFTVSLGMQRTAGKMGETVVFRETYEDWS